LLWTDLRRSVTNLYWYLEEEQVERVWMKDAEAAMGHYELARWGDIFGCLAPAIANIMDSKLYTTGSLQIDLSHASG